MAEPPSSPSLEENKVWKGVFAVVGIMSTLLVYGVLQFRVHVFTGPASEEKIMRVPYGENKEYFRYSLFLVFCNRLMTSAVSAGALLASKKALDPVAPVYKYCLVSVSNILTTTCQYEALKYVSFPVQTLAKCAKMIPVMVHKAVRFSFVKFYPCCVDTWNVVLPAVLLDLYPVTLASTINPWIKLDFDIDSNLFSDCVLMIFWRFRELCLDGWICHMWCCPLWSTFIMQKVYKAPDYLLAFLVMLGCALFILYPAAGDVSPYNRGRDSTVWGVSLMLGYLGFDGFTSTFQDKLFKGYNMEIHNQIFYTTLCSCVLSLTGSTTVDCLLVSYQAPTVNCLIVQGHLLMAIDFVAHHNDCFFDIALLSTVATISQFFISYTIRTFGALTFATIMTTRQLVSILLSCVWFAHPLSWEQCIGAVIVFGSLYAKSFLRSKPQKPSPAENLENGESSPLKGNP
ncbi:hypothetical protein RHSIM_Rhsim01G0224300 [Rhododendron simsii]|uniref:Uncharacterized protein n=1 Tax=Rhododendron simsii TaxID=118357 RepID=A0A834HJ57_RHOSS|nr:hypothetical protein RHSIM_Rhsim01G0224300 [Rhododendron simsii]